MTVYEVVGAVDAGVANSLHPDDGTILVEQDESAEYLVARPKSGGDET